MVNRNTAREKETLIPEARMTQPAAVSFTANADKRGISVRSVELETDRDARVTLVAERLVKGEWVESSRVTGGGGRGVRDDGTLMAPFGFSIDQVKGDQYRITVMPSKGLTLALEAE